MDLVVKNGGVLNGEVRIPSDKSISHRAIILGSIAHGKSLLHGFLKSKDCLATLHAMQQLGVHIENVSSQTICVHGVGLHGLKAPIKPIDCGNAGTGMRLLAGLLAGQSFTSELQGDHSLSGRPMERIVHPLQKMGAKLVGHEVNNKIFAPLQFQKSTLQGIHYTLPVASAQVKSCLLIAGLYAQGETVLIEKEPTRDHTERLLQSFGCSLTVNKSEMTLNPGDELKGREIFIPGDISSAAFFIAGAAMVPGFHVILHEVGVNPRRIGIIHILKQMGANITLNNQRLMSEEPVADIEIKGTQLKGIEVPNEWVASAIDEFPILFIAAASAQGKTIFRGLEELRVKETDRLQVMATGLKVCGVDVESLPDGLIILGTPLQGGVINSQGDHRVAMAFALASVVSKNPITILDCENIATSFPNFCGIANELGLRMEEVR